MFFREGYAQPSHDVIIIEALDGANRQAVAGYRKRDTRAGGLAVDQHGTSTADAMFTAEMRTRQPALFAQKVGRLVRGSTSAIIGCALTSIVTAIMS